MNYKELLRIAILLVSSPARAWEEIRLEEDRRKVFSTFVYPMIGLCGLAVFINSLWTNGWSDPISFQTAMTKCCAVAVSLFGGYFLAAFVINRLGIKMFGLENNPPLIQRFAGYASVVIFGVRIISGLFPGFNMIGNLLQFYTIYIIWESIPLLIPVEEKDRLMYTITTSLLLVMSPTVIQIIFDNLTAVLY